MAIAAPACKELSAVNILTLALRQTHPKTVPSQATTWQHAGQPYGLMLKQQQASIKHSAYNTALHHCLRFAAICCNSPLEL
jgi:hypothetical protein